MSILLTCTVHVKNVNVLNKVNVDPKSSDASPFTAVRSSLLHYKRQHLHRTLSSFHTDASEKAKAQITHLQLKASGHKTGPVSTQERLISLVYVLVLSSLIVDSAAV